ncbi:hypothetical protein TSUD_100660 [Trifolium subterraneum]|uniref:Uncharacterized protein n=1 Tax=Trifolium subterraneum TaxID=3900 RepID=A0A2Z6PGF3_TRISU|nr:hypothetical protein TSUD_100660 [Trifolium subterraneum]
MGQEDCSCGPNLSINSHQVVKGGAGRRISKSEGLDQFFRPDFSDLDSGGKRVRCRGVYSDGPSAVFQRLNYGPRVSAGPEVKLSLKRSSKNLSQLVVPSGSSIGTKQLLAKTLKSKSHSNGLPSSHRSFSASSSNFNPAIVEDELAANSIPLPSSIGCGNQHVTVSSSSIDGEARAGCGFKIMATGNTFGG